jgi:hypothetical protein
MHGVLTLNLERLQTGRRRRRRRRRRRGRNVIQ